MVKTLLLICICGCIVIETAYARFQSPTRSKETARKRDLESQQRLRTLQQNLTRERERLKKVRQKEQQVSRNLTTYQQKDKKLRTMLRDFTASIGRTSDSLERTRERLTNLTARANLIRREYGDVANLLVLTGSPSLAEMLSVRGAAQNEMTTRGIVRAITAQTEQQLGTAQQRGDSLLNAREQLAGTLRKTTNRKQATESTKTKLQGVIGTKRQELKSVQSEREALVRHIEDMNASARKMQALIGNLVNKAERASGKSVPLPPKPHSVPNTGANASDDNRAEQAAIEARAASVRGGFRRHSLPWPLQSHTLAHKFGRYTNAATGTIIENPGIGIATPAASAVRSVGAGVVSLVNWLPGYGSLVIIDHGNSFRSVYANLASVSVAQGQHVKPGTVLGKSGRAADGGEYLHFELWHDRDKINPIAWLE
jgi:murein hydrolase activator